MVALVITARFVPAIGSSARVQTFVVIFTSIVLEVARPAAGIHGRVVRHSRAYRSCRGNASPNVVKVIRQFARGATRRLPDKLQVTSLKREIIDSPLERVHRLEVALTSAGLLAPVPTARELDLVWEWIAARDAQRQAELEDPRR